MVILIILGSIFNLFDSIVSGMVGAGLLPTDVFEGLLPTDVFEIYSGGFFGNNVTLMIAGIEGIFWGIVYLIIGYGLFNGKGWSWTYTVLLQIIIIPYSIIVDGLIKYGDITETFNIQIFYIISGIIILWYMLKPKTRAYFGKVKLDNN
jgi:hypothetical protein